MTHYPWSDATDDAVHLPTLGKMAAIHRLVRGESFHDRAIRAGLTTGQLYMAELGLCMSVATADKLLSVCGYHRAPFTRRFFGPVLDGLDRCATANSREAQRVALQEKSQSLEVPA